MGDRRSVLKSWDRGPNFLRPERYRSAATIEFEIKIQGDEYVDLSQTYVQLLCKFTKDNGTDLTGGNDISTPVNHIIHSLFSEIDLSLNGKVITPGTDTYS